jgi:hypothetical protein
MAEIERPAGAAAKPGDSPALAAAVAAFQAG